MQEIPLEQLLKEHIISQRTYDKVILSKKYIERKYNIKSKKYEQMKNRITLSARASVETKDDENSFTKKQSFN